MTSYLRSIFGSQQNTAPSAGSSASKSHSRSRSVPQTQNLSYIYAVPGTTSSTSSRPSHKRSNSFITSHTTTPSPLRYATYNSSSAHGHGPPPSHSTRPPMSRSASYKTGDRPMPYPLYTPSVSFSSSRSDSSSSLHPGSASGASPASLPRTSSSGNVRYPDARPALRQNHTWHAEPPNPAPSPYAAQRSASLHMHPLLACSRLHSAPLTYDVSYTPSSRTVLDRNTRMAVPAETLGQPATMPSTMNRLVLRSDKFPWTVVVTSSHSKSGSRFYLGSSGKSSTNTPVTNLDVLYAIHNTLSSRVTQQEWESLGHGSSAQRKATRAYEKRCIKMGGGWEGGVRRIDWLGKKTRLVGIEVDKSAGGGGTGKIIFGKA